jgi:hypothetical protein
MSDEATPRPWRAADHLMMSGAERTVHIGAGDCNWAVGSLVAVLPNDCGPRDDERERRLQADAALAVRAVNSFDALMAACKLWDEGFTEGEQFDPEQFLAWVNKNRAAARAALALATP